MWAVVAADVRFAKVPVALTRLAIVLNVTRIGPPPGLSLEGTATAPVSSMLYGWVGQFPTGLNAQLVACWVQHQPCDPSAAGAPVSVQTRPWGTPWLYTGSVSGLTPRGHL